VNSVIEKNENFKNQDYKQSDYGDAYMTKGGKNRKRN
jgi:hypothetical protein